MTETITPRETTPLVLQMRPAFEMTDEQFFEFCQLNRDFRIERSKDGELIIMSPAGSKTGNRNFSLTGQFWSWVEGDGTGIGFDSSAGFTLPNGATKASDLAWMKWEN